MSTEIDWTAHEERVAKMHEVWMFAKQALESSPAPADRKAQLWEEWDELLIELRAYAGAVAEKDPEALALAALIYGSDLIGEEVGR